MSASVSFPWKQDRNVKVEGKDNNLLELIAADPAFNLTLEELQKTMDPYRNMWDVPKSRPKAFIAKDCTAGSGCTQGNAWNDS